MGQRDRFQGYAELPFTGTPLRGTPGLFRTGIQGSRVGMVDPEDRWWPWIMCYVVGANGSKSPLASDGATGGLRNGKSMADYAVQKYGAALPGDPDLRWSQQALAQLVRWGFTGTQAYSANWVLPSAAYGGYGHSWQTIDPRPAGGVVDWQTADNQKPRGSSAFPQPRPLPTVAALRVTHYGTFNSGSLAPDAFKTLHTVNAAFCNLSRFAGGAYFPDVFDPNWLIYMQKALALGTYKWRVAVFVDDTDEMVGFGNGPDFKAPVPGQPHLGWSALCARPWIVTGKARNGAAWTYKDPTLFTKRVLRDRLAAQYGTIAALNAAWGSDYTTFDEEDAIGHTSWGTGRGLMDEDGRHAWVGAGFSNEIASGILIHCAPAVRADLDAFAEVIAEEYFRNVAATVRTKCQHLYGGIFNTGSWGVPPHRFVLAAAGRHCDLLHATPINTGATEAQNQTQLDFFLEHLGREVPFASWVGAPANADSAMWTAGAAGFATQLSRADWYRKTVDLITRARSRRGYCLGMGLSFWGWGDQWNENLNWGLVTIRHNPYDAVHARLAPPATDPEGYPTIPEDADYGDFITPLTAAHLAVEDTYRAQLAELGPAPTPDPTPVPGPTAPIFRLLSTTTQGGSTMPWTVKVRAGVLDTQGNLIRQPDAVAHRLYRDGAKIQDAAQPAGGPTEFTLTVPEPELVLKLGASALDAAGNESPVAALDVPLDATAPIPPTFRLVSATWVA